MTKEELAAAISLGHEQRGLEFKGPGLQTDKQLMMKVARAVLGMANRRDGGRVIIGVVDDDGGLDPVGLNVDHLRTWTYDDVSATVARYADPMVSFGITNVIDDDGRTFVILRVEEFRDIPILCKKGFTDEQNRVLLRDGACYVRSWRKPETSEIPTHEEMRELIDIAVDKKLREFVSRAQTAGLLDSAGRIKPNDSELFAQQQERMWTN
jgi:predicted HTH transcriptional regulator